MTLQAWVEHHVLSVAARLWEGAASEQSLQGPKSHPPPPHLSPVTENLVRKRTKEAGMMLSSSKAQLGCTASSQWL